jgi:hypothetical protein
MGKQETAVTGKNRIMIYGPKADSTYFIEFKTAAGEALAISVPRGETAVLKHFQERMPYGLFVPDVPTRLAPRDTLMLKRASRSTCACMTICGPKRDH